MSTTLHSVTTRQDSATGRWHAICSCGETCPRPSTHKPLVDQWRSQHYQESR